MQVFEGLESAAGHLDGAAVTIGNFDGVHLGHQRLVERCVAQARRRKTKAVALTFWPHPARVLAPDFAPPLIVSRTRRLELLEAAGLDAVIEQPFDRAVAAMAPAEFTRLLLDEVGARAIVVGYDFTYGAARAGRLETLRLACEDRGAQLEVIDPVSVAGLVVSSTKIREFVLAGNVEGAASLLGRPFDLEGVVVRGDGRGRSIGVPTANVSPEADLVPGIGVYAVRVRLPDGSPALGACNVGINPTFRPESSSGPASRALRVEVHILDRDLDLYGQRLRVAFVQRLRVERRFQSVDELVRQIRADIVEARRVLV